jgi:hypothetical protein
MWLFGRPRMRNIDSVNAYFRYEANMLDYLAHISIRRSFIYQETPKVACSTIKRRLQIIENPMASLEAISNREHSPLKRPSDTGIPLSELYEGVYFSDFLLLETRSLEYYLHT